MVCVVCEFWCYLYCQIIAFQFMWAPSCLAGTRAAVVFRSGSIRKARLFAAVLCRSRLPSRGFSLTLVLLWTSLLSPVVPDSTGQLCFLMWASDYYPRHVSTFADFKEHVYQDWQIPRPTHLHPFSVSGSFSRNSKPGRIALAPAYRVILILATMIHKRCLVFHFSEPGLFAIRFSNSDLGAFLTAFIFSRSCCRVYEFHMFVFALLFELCFQARQF
jgi:hypothetical protein